MAMKTERQMNLFRRITYGTLGLLGLAATAFALTDTYSSSSESVDALTGCRNTISVDERMNCAWQIPEVVASLMADSDFRADIVQGLDAKNVTDANVYETDAALGSTLAQAESSRANAIARTLTAGVAGTVAVSALASIWLVRPKRWNGNTRQFYYE